MPVEEQTGAAEEEALDNLIGDQTLPQEEEQTSETTAAAEHVEAEQRPEDSRFAEMQRRLAEMEETNATLRAENAVHRTRRAEAPAPPVVETDEDEPLPDDETFRATAQKAPVQAVSMVVERAVRRATRELERRFESRIAGQTATDRARQRALADYGAYLSDNEFVQAAEAEYAALRDESGKNRPQDIYTAYATAYANMVRVGKQPKARNGNGNGATQPRQPEGLRERVRRSSVPDTGTGTPESAARAQTPFEQDFRTERELAGVRATCKKFGITLEKFKQNYNEEKARDSFYGTGR